MKWELRKEYKEVEVEEVQQEVVEDKIQKKTVLVKKQICTKTTEQALAEAEEEATKQFFHSRSLLSETSEKWVFEFYNPIQKEVEKKEQIHE